MKMLQNVRLRQNFAIFWVDLYDEREKEKTRLGEQRLKTIKREGKDKSLHCVVFAHLVRGKKALPELWCKAKPERFNEGN